MKELKCNLQKLWDAAEAVFREKFKYEGKLAISYKLNLPLSYNTDIRFLWILSKWSENACRCKTPAHVYSNFTYKHQKLGKKNNLSFSRQVNK